MTVLQSILLGIIEGITEFLPVSSTAHLIIGSELLGLLQTEFVKSFEIIIQLGAICAVIVLYARRLMRNHALWSRIIVAFIPTGIIGFLLYRIIKGVLIGNMTLIVLTLGIGGMILIIFEYIYGRGELPESGTLKDQELEHLSYKKSFIIGTAQALAVIPGVSRSAATIVAGRVLGMSRTSIIEFSFLLAIPTMAAATGYDLFQNAHAFSQDQFVVLVIGFIVAFVSALIAVKFLLRFVEKRGFIAFGVYRIVVAFIIFTFLF